ncbi:hypothetical protein ABPG72_015484 [Tetrahymena utriculariae]
MSVNSMSSSISSDQDFNSVTFQRKQDFSFSDSRSFSLNSIAQMSSNFTLNCQQQLQNDNTESEKQRSMTSIEEEQEERKENNNHQIQKLQKKIKKVKYLFKLCQPLEINECFLIEGEFLFYPKAFMRYQIHNNLEQSSQMNQFRPVRKVNFFEDQRIDIELDNFIDCYGNVEVVKQYLNRLSDQKSKQMCMYINYYEMLIQDQYQTLKLVKEYYLNKEQELIDKLDENFQKSLQQAHKFMEKLNKQNSLTLYFLRRVNPTNLFKKSHSIGGTKTLLDVIFGQDAVDKQTLKQKLMREGMPNLIDYRGLVQHIIQSFSGTEGETIDLMTIDLFKIPCKIQSMNLPLSSVEIIPGYTVYDELLYTTYIPTNSKILDNILKVRKEQQNLHTQTYQIDISDFSYEAKSEQFVEKYYPDVSYQLKFKRKKPENFKKPLGQQEQNKTFSNMSIFSN